MNPKASWIILFVFLSCSSGIKEEISVEPNYVDTLGKKVNLQVFSERKNPLDSLFYIGRDSCTVLQKFEKINGEEQRLTLEFFPKKEVQNDTIRGILNAWLHENLRLDSCLQKFCTYYVKSTNNRDLEISFIDETSLRKTPYIALEFYEKDGIAE